MAVGALLLAAAVGFGLSGASRSFALACGVAGVVLGGLYLVSPAWRIRVLVDDAGLEVLTGRGDRRFRLPWDEVVQVIASPSTRTCFVDGGDPGRSLVVPGEGAHAPYDIEDKERLYELIVARVDPARIDEVALLSAVAADKKRSAAADAKRAATADAPGDETR